MESTKDTKSSIQSPMETKGMDDTVCIKNISSTTFEHTWPAPFTEFTVIGCNNYALRTSSTAYRRVSTGCMIFCLTQQKVVADECAGNGCCQSSIPHGLNYYVAQKEDRGYCADSA